MSIFNSPADTPGRLNEETNQITLKFERTGPTTGKVSWNIPVSSLQSCSDASDGVYCGMVITLGNTQATPLEAPVNGTIYNADPSGDANIHVGDRIGSQLVVGSFYQNKHTTSLDIFGLNADSAYYIQGYPVDCQYRYDSNNGVAAYERSLGKPKEPDLPAQHAIRIDGVSGPDATNLIPGQIYTFTIKVGNDTYDINVDGINAITYDDLIAELNRQFLLLGNPNQSPFAPNTNSYYWNTTAQKLYQWTGSQLVEIPSMLIQSTDPSIIAIGTYWLDLNSNNNTINYWNGTNWVSTPYIIWGHDITTPVCDEYWFNGTNTYQWSGDVWNLLKTTVQTDDPCQVNTNLCGAYWYNTSINQLFKYDNGIWTSTEAIYWPTNPVTPSEHTITTDGTFWFDLTNNKLFEYYLPAGWTEQNVEITVTQPVQPTPGNIFWFDPNTEVLKKYNISTLTWSVVNVLVWPNDPAVSVSGDLWWNATTDDLYTWNVLTSTWTLVDNFYQTAVDPRTCPTLIVGEMWYNSNTGVLSRWDGVDWIPVNFIQNPVNPITPDIDTVWYNSTTDEWNIWSGFGWSPLTPMASIIDPSSIPTGTFWFDTASNILHQRNGLIWMPVTYSTTNPIPQIGTVWYDTQNNILKQWDGKQWVVTPGIVNVDLDANSNVIFTTKELGGCANVFVQQDTNPGNSNNLFTTLKGIWTIPTTGTDGLDNTPMYNQYNVGDDYTTDERKQLMHQIRLQLGYPTVEVELTPSHLNVCIDNALQVLRKRSGIAYHRNYFFLDVKPGVQKYVLTNKCVGFNTIVDVMSLHRISSAIFQGAGGVWGQAMLQQLYFAGAGSFDMLTYDLLGQYVNQLEVQLAARLQFQWNEHTRALWIMNTFHGNERILVDAVVERTEQELFVDRWTSNWIQKFTLGQCMQLLAQIRGKFGSLPGAGGNITLNASDLQTQGDAMIEALLAQIDDYIVDHPEDYGMGSTFVWG